MLKRFVFLLLLLPVANAGATGAMTVFASNEDAQNCYMTAKLASSTAMPDNMWGDDSCTSALEFPLSRRDRTAVFVNRGIIRVSNEQYQEAFEDYKRALEIEPAVAETYANLANLYFLGEKHDTAIDYYNKALERGVRQDFVIYTNRGMAKEAMGRLADAEADYRQALSINPDWVVPAQKLERVLRKQGASS